MCLLWLLCQPFFNNRCIGSRLLAFYVGPWLRTVSSSLLRSFVKCHSVESNWALFGLLRVKSGTACLWCRQALHSHHLWWIVSLLFLVKKAWICLRSLGLEAAFRVLRVNAGKDHSRNARFYYVSFLLSLLNFCVVAQSIPTSFFFIWILFVAACLHYFSNNDLELSFWLLALFYWLWSFVSLGFLFPRAVALCAATGALFLRNWAAKTEQMGLESQLLSVAISLLPKCWMQMQFSRSGCIGNAAILTQTTSLALEVYQSARC